MKELLNEIDDLLCHLENFIHGKDGNDITEMRYKIIEALRQPDVSSNEGNQIEFNKKVAEVALPTRCINEAEIYMGRLAKCGNQNVCELCRQ